ncbi:MAG TPA: right-handed parallel beta-helix repeat-containing protein [Bdellovibrionota bacterium]|nr:right-handed parallel beta-helix repeat-containing protein [Bdellovibrionota bacterium]
MSETSPWCTLGKAGSNVQPGDTVHVRGGTYTEVQTCLKCNDNSVLQIVVSGTSADPIRFVAASGETVTIDGSGGAQHGIQIIETYDSSVQPKYVEVDGFVVKNVPGACVAVTDTTDVTVRNLDVSSCGGWAMSLNRTVRVTLEWNRIHDNPMAGWTSAVDLFECLDGNVVRGNFIWANSDEDPQDSEGHGITMDTCGSTGGALIESNVIWDNEGWCLSMYKSDNGILRNNTCFMNGRRSGVGEVTVLGNQYQVHNNILIPRDGQIALNLRTIGSYTVDASTIESDYNLLWSATHSDVAMWGDGVRGTVAEYQAENEGGWDAHTIQADPMLKDTAADDFSLTAGSPAIDGGDDAHAASSDILDGARPVDGNGDGAAVVDLGAYEFNATPGTGGGGLTIGPPSAGGGDGGCRSARFDVGILSTFALFLGLSSRIVLRRRQLSRRLQMLMK